MVVRAPCCRRSETKPTISRKFGSTSTTWMPCCCTSCGSSGVGQLQLVLHLHLGDVRVGALLEGERDLPAAGGVAGRGHVEQVVDAVQLLLDDLGDRCSATVCAEAPG